MNLLLAALVNGAIVGAGLTAALWLVLRVTPRSVLNAATRYALWWATLALIVALPVFYLPRRTVARQEAATAPAVSQPVSHSVSAPPRYSAPALPSVAFRPHDDAVPAAPRFPIRIVTSGWPRWVLLGWAAASLLLLFRLAASFLLLARTSGRAEELPGRRLYGTSRRGVRVAASADIPVPVAVGPWRPAILIPAGLLAELGEQELEQIILHEASHLERRDDYALVMQRLVEALFSLHPVVRWIARRIDLEREVACDDRVVALTGRARSYATCLTRVVEWSGHTRSSLAAATAAEHGSLLARRIDMLLDKTRHRGTQLLKARLSAIVVMVTALAWMAGRSPGLVAFASPLGRVLRQVPARLAAPSVLLATVAETPQSPPAVFEARVLEDSSGNPLPSAEIRFRKPGMRELAADLDTDRNGRARAAGLAAGEYAVEVMKPNFVTASLKLRVPLADFTVRLVRYGVISGQITDQGGHPVPSSIHEPGGRAVGGARIAILMKDPASGRLELLRESGPAEEGRFRLYDLTPGQYVIGLWYDGLEDGSGVQLYPDNAHPRLFTVSGGEEYDHVDFMIARQAVYSVSGRIDGAKKGDVYALALGVPDQPALPLARTLSAEDGSFRFAKVPAGSYDLLAGGPSRGYGAHDDLLGPAPLFGRVHIDVAQNVEGVAVPVGAGRSVSVVLRAKGPDAPPPGCPQSASVSVEPLEAWGLYFNSSATAQAAFGKETQIRNLAPGRFRFSLTGLPEGCFQSASPLADLSGEQPAPVAIEVAQAGSLRGSLRGADRPAEFSIVLLDAAGAPDAPAQLVQPDAQGRFAFESLRPGRYRIAALPASPGPQARWVTDVSRLVEIEVAAGSPTVIELPAAPKAGRQ